MHATSDRAGDRSGGGPTIAGMLLLLLLAFVLWQGVAWQLLFIVPPFVRLFADFSMKLPATTEAVVAVSRWFANYWYVAVISAVPVAAVAVVISWWVRQRSAALNSLWFTLLLVPPLFVHALVEWSLVEPLYKVTEGLSAQAEARRRTRPEFPKTDDKGLLVQTAEMTQVQAPFEDYNIFYPRPFAAPPELAIDAYPEESYQFVEQRKDGFRILFLNLITEAPKPHYRARGLPAPKE